MIGADLSILVVGGGIAGLAVARTLRLAGFRPDVVERLPATTVAGAGIYLPGNGARALRALGLHDGVRPLGAVIERQRVYTSRGDLLLDVDVADVWAGVGECRALPRADLHRVLVSGAGGDLRYDTEVRGLEIDSRSAKVDFGDGSRGDYELVIAADGRRSKVRALAGLGGAARPVGQLAYRAVVTGGPDLDAWTVLLGRGTSFLAVPIGAGTLYCYADETLRPGAVPAGQAAAAARLRERFSGYGGPVPALLDLICAGPIQVAVIEEVDLRTWTRGPVVLIGDAAHATSPNMAQGAAMALEDAIVLADELRRAPDVPTALVGYEARRCPRTTWVLHQTHQRDRARGLAAPLRRALFRLRGQAMFRANYRPLLDPP
jgi:FAD-dependent urate hydroxylase